MLKILKETLSGLYTIQNRSTLIQSRSTYTFQGLDSLLTTNT